MVGRQKVLIVEDDGLLQKIFKAKFTLEGYDVDTADDGEDGLAKVRTGSPDIVLLDILIPKLHGLQVLAEIRRDPVIKNVPVVMLSNLSNTDQIERAMTMGAAGYLVKSDTSPGEVLEFVRDTIANMIRADVAGGRNERTC